MRIGILLAAFILTMVVYNQCSAQCNSNYLRTGEYEISCPNNELTVRFFNGKLCSFARIEVILKKGPKPFLELGFVTPDGRGRKYNVPWTFTGSGFMAELIPCFDYRPRLDDGRGRFFIGVDNNQAINIGFSLDHKQVDFIHN